MWSVVPRRPRRDVGDGVEVINRARYGAVSLSAIYPALRSFPSYDPPDGAKLGHEGSRSQSALITALPPDGSYLTAI